MSTGGELTDGRRRANTSGGVIDHSDAFSLSIDVTVDGLLVVTRMFARFQERQDISLLHYLAK